MRVLTLDIETMAHKGYFWRLWKENIGTSQIVEPTQMISFSAKWLDQRGKPFHSTIHQGKNNMLAALHTLMSEADAIVTYNGEGFDMKHINREFVLAGLPPVRPCASIDLFKFVKSNFALPSNRLDYVAEYFLGIRKLDTGGFALWPAFMERDDKAVRLMERYNNRDVVITEKLYKFFKPYIRNHPYLVDRPVDFGDSLQMYECPVCGTETNGSYHKNAQRRTRCYAVRQVQCRKCDHWFDGKRKKLT